MNTIRTLSGVAALAIGGLLFFSSNEAHSGVGTACPPVAIGPYGTGCAQFFDVPVLKGGYDPSSCTVTLALSGISGCCNTFLSSRILIVGVSPVSIPVPPFVSGCTLLASPDLILAFPASAGNEFTFPVPAIDLTVYIQGVNDYFTTIGFNHDFNWSNGLKVSIG